MGYVYLIGTTTFGWYKSKTPEVRVTNLGVLLPFKVKVYCVWAAKDHSAMERALHELYAANRINGEWFEFTIPQIKALIASIPPETVVSSEALDSFSNLGEDTRKGKRVIGVRTQKLRGNFTPEEREAKRQAAILEQAKKRALNTPANTTPLP